MRRALKPLFAQAGSFPVSVIHPVSVYFDFSTFGHIYGATEQEQELGSIAKTTTSFKKPQNCWKTSYTLLHEH